VSGDAPIASVVIPTCNVGPLLLDVVDAVLKQEAPWPFELIVIDSASDDGSLDGIRSRATADERLRIIDIDRSAFGHGRTRNQGVKFSRGEYVAFLTQDALPSSNSWLSSLVSAVAASDRIAGGFGRHVAHLEHSCVTRCRIDRHFRRYRNTPLLRIDNSERYQADSRYRQFLYFYSDNNSCLRKDIWRNIPYPDIEFGEDQAWSKLVLEAGYEITYVDNAAVSHSHEYNSRSAFKRSSEEAFHFEKYFGHGVCGSLLMAAAMAARWSVQDVLCLLKHDRSLRGLRLAAQSPVRNLYRAAGYWYGSHRFRRSGAKREIVGQGLDA